MAARIKISKINTTTQICKKRIPRRLGRRFRSSFCSSFCQTCSDGFSWIVSSFSLKKSNKSGMVRTINEDRWVELIKTFVFHQVAKFFFRQDQLTFAGVDTDTKRLCNFNMLKAFQHIKIENCPIARRQLL